MALRVKPFLDKEGNPMQGDVVKLDTKSMPWQEEFNEAAGKSLFFKSLIKDADTGMEITVTRYPAGFINPTHDHPCAHGMYVLEGTLHTSEGDFGPGSFLWFPEGKVMWHGGTADRDVQILFITNKPFAIRYV